MLFRSAEGQRKADPLKVSEGWKADARVVDAQRFHGTLALEESDLSRWSRRRATQLLCPHEPLIVFEGLASKSIAPSLIAS